MQFAMVRDHTDQWQLYNKRSLLNVWLAAMMDFVINGSNTEGSSTGQMRLGS